jgi:predicted NAD/FAD-binding protein
MKTAIIGTGIAGMTTAYLLSQEHHITIFEANNYIGGHTNTIQVEREYGNYAVDTGFIVFNQRTYPNFVKLMQQLRVEWQDSNMSFSVKNQESGLEFSPSSLNSLFAQRKNIFSPGFYRMMTDVIRFRKESTELIDTNNYDTTLSEYLNMNRYSKEFISDFLIPMGAAIWSADPKKFHDFPARYFVEFFRNHGFLELHQPQWLTIQGGSNQYIQPLTKPYRENIRLNAPVAWIKRHPDYVEVKPLQGEVERFDQVVIAAHSNQALDMLVDPSDDERDILGSILYQPNLAILHTDISILPRRKKAWASWNYHISGDDSEGVAVTYNMNKLQSIDAPETFCVTLNRPELIDPAKIITQIWYDHPVYNVQSLKRQKQHHKINGVNRTYYAGAYWGYGFHEDGVNSALEVTKHFGKTL